MVILLFVILLSMGEVAASEASLSEVGQIPLPGVHGRIDHFAQDVSGKRLFLAALGNDSVEVLDVAQGRVVHSITGVKEPQGVAFLANLNRVVITEGDGNAIDIIDGTSFIQLGRIEHMEDADNIRIDPKSGLVYVGVGSGKSSALAVVDAKAMSVQRQIALPGHPEAFEFEANGPRIFVNVPTDRAIVLVDRTTGATLARWALKEAASNFPMAFDAASHRLFVACRSPATLLIYDSEAGSLVASIPCCGDADDVFVDSAAKHVYVSGGEGTVTVIDSRDPVHYAVLSTVETTVGARTAWFDSEVGLLYVACPPRLGHDAAIRIYTASRP